jgi:hypothetical protein
VVPRSRSQASTVGGVRLSRIDELLLLHVTIQADHANQPTNQPTNRRMQIEERPVRGFLFSA